MGDELNETICAIRDALELDLHDHAPELDRLEREIRLLRDVVRAAETYEECPVSYGTAYDGALAAYVAEFPNTL